MKNFISLMKREFRLLRTNSVVVAVFIGGPLLYGLVLGVVYSKGKVNNLPVLVVDMDNSPMSQKAIDIINDTEALVVDVNYSHKNEKELILKKDYNAVITIPERFEADIIQKRHPEIQVEVNTANILPANYSVKALQLALGTLNAGIEIQGLTKKGVPEATAKEQYNSFGVNYARFFNKSANYMVFLWPGVLGVIIQQVFMLALALSFSREFEEDTFFTEFYPKAKNPWYAMFVKSILFWIIGAIILILVWGMFPLFKVPFHTDPMAIIGLIFGLLLSVTFMGIAVSLLIPSQLKSTEVLMIIATPSFILSGFTWPLSQMPESIVLFAKTIPLTHFLEGLRKVMLYDANFSDILPEFRGLMYIALFYAVVSYIAFKVHVKRKKEIA